MPTTASRLKSLEGALHPSQALLEEEKEPGYDCVCMHQSLQRWMQGY